jgi:hypothetical protein
VTFSGFSLDGTSKENYSLFAQPASVKAKITAKNATITGLSVEEEKIYDGNTTAEITGNEEITGKIDKDDLKVKEGVGKANFEDEKADDGKTVEFSGFTLEGADAGNYLLEQPASVTANITKKPLTIENTGVNNKPYDGLKTAEFSGTPALNGVISKDVVKDDVTLTNGIPSFSSAGVADNIEIEFTDFSIGGVDAPNYSLTQPSGVTANILPGFTAEKGKQYTLNSADGPNGWFVAGNFKITAESGYKLSEINSAEGDWADSLTYSAETSEIEKTFYVKNTSTKEISTEQTEKYKKDSTSPTGTITIKSNLFKNFISAISFGLFFKNSVDVTIAAADTVSGVKSIQYLKTDTEYTSETIGLASDWVNYSDKISIEIGEKAIIYAKLTDNAGNISYISSDGVVIYNDSEQSTQEIEFIKTSTAGVPAKVTLNGNTVGKIMNGSNKLLLNTDY